MSGIELDNVELLKQAKLRPWEKRLSEIAPLFGVIALFSYLAVARYLVVPHLDLSMFDAIDGPILLIPPLIIIALMLVTVFAAWLTVDKIATRRSRRLIHELRRRLEVPRWEVTLASERESMKLWSSPDWVLICHGAMLPHGGELLIVVKLFDDPGRPVDLFIHQCPMIDDRLRSLKGHLRTSLTVPVESTYEIRAALRNLDEKPLETIESHVVDGYPCHLTVFRRNPLTEWNGDCNLVGLSDCDAARPTAAILVAMHRCCADVRSGKGLGCAAFHNDTGDIIITDA